MPRRLTVVLLLLIGLLHIANAQTQAIQVLPATVSSNTASPRAPIKQPSQPSLKLLRQRLPNSIEPNQAQVEPNPNTHDKLSDLSLNEGLTLSVSMASLLVSLLAVIVGWKVYNRFLSQKLTENQLQIVLDLIKCIYDDVFVITTVRRHESAGMGYGYDYKNLFQIANGGALPADSEYNYPVLLLNSYTFTFEPWVFLSNPLLPNKIGEKLLALHDSIVMIPADPEKIKTYIVIGKRKEEKPEPEVVLSQIEGGISAFQSHCVAINHEIKAWLKTHGLKDLNQHVVSTDYNRWLV
jgi:hypothetical protein